MDKGQIKHFLLSQRVIQSNGCWFWKGKANIYGYPATRARQGSHPTRKVTWWVNQVWDLPGEGPQILHKCHDKRCWNPAHLRKGTHQENMRDKIKAGTSGKGEGHNQAKLTLSQVEEIRQRSRLGETSKSISKDYPVSRRHISRIIRKERWS